jgi:23S rRNA pseudouridine2604 synthase
MPAPSSRPPQRPKPNQRQPAREAAPLSKDVEGERLSKRVALMLPCSRKDAEQYIEGGWVTVNGKVVEEPQHRVTDQTILVDPKASLLDLAPVTLLLHKPVGHAADSMQLLNVAHHALDDASGTRVLKRHFAKLTPGIGLEKAASGLVVFSQDWRIVRKLEEDAHTMEQELLVEVAGQVPPEVLQRLNQGMAQDGERLPAVKVSVNSTSAESSRLRFAVKGAHPGLVAYLCERVGLQITSLKRMRLGRVSLAQLPAGQWRYLQAHERF